MSGAARDQSTTKRTFADVASLDPERSAGELVRGVWLPATRNTWKHGEIVANVAVLLKLWARTHPEWSVSVGDPGTKLARDPDVLRGPDVGVVRRDRVPTGTGEDGWLEGSPDFAVEVLGDAQSTAVAMEKVLELLAAGAQLVWIVDPIAERVLVMTPPDHVAVVGAKGTLDASSVLPELRCSVSDIFAR